MQPVAHPKERHARFPFSALPFPVDGGWIGLNGIRPHLAPGDGNHQDRPSGSAQDPAGRAAHECVFQGALAVGAHDDQVAGVIPRLLDNLFGRKPLAHFNLPYAHHQIGIETTRLFALRHPPFHREAGHLPQAGGQACTYQHILWFV